ncbi:molybdate ABC transporter substrate-binding protein [Fodinicola feengrottensis]|uniref:Molybdate ABC transporter substrate-binding protein n=1 Tax=Fodinicola feengrottensis TaxID=435914 RepID=A0ABP4SUR6_9ACTN|nr:molybdate ABC transporter substrate-binding protein [Fodinicola feengrottensis]
MRVKGPLVRRASGLLATVALVAATAACGGGGTTGANPSASTPSTHKITVFAAASLTESFGTIGKNFEKANPGDQVTFNFGASSTLATQITQGAPADVFASASKATMDTVVKANDNDGASQPFLTNTLEIVVPKGNPAHITGLKDFADSTKKTVLCAESVPCGALAKQVFDAAHITPKPVDRGTDVKAVLQKVALGEADAAMVYKTDVLSGGPKVEGITFPESASKVTTYPICSLKASKDASTAKAFVAYVLSPAGRQVLAAAGFGAA